jgi:hypothetical protein
MKLKDAFSISINYGKKALKENIIEDGFMKHKDDMDGLTKYLEDMKVIPSGSNMFKTEQASEEYIEQNKESENFDPNSVYWFDSYEERGRWTVNVKQVATDKYVWQYDSDKEDKDQEDGE